MQFTDQIKELMQQGLSHKEATAKVVKESWQRFSPLRGVGCSPCPASLDSSHPPLRSRGTAAPAFLQKRFRHLPALREVINEKIRHGAYFFKD